LTRGTVLCIEEREEISRGIVADESGREIARRLGRHYSVVNRKIVRNGGRSTYRASEAQRNAAVFARRPKYRKIESDPLLLTEVNKGLALKWSPQQISVRLKKDFPDNEVIRVSPETVYQALLASR
jgi:transposase, IS30 family